MPTQSDTIRPDNMAATHSASPLRYRPDIDALRAIAVLPVILFHAGSSLFSGGFAGVDVFFVISGFLISGIIIGQAEGGRFRFADFYYRRARRLLPTLFTVMLATVAAGYVLLIPSAYAALFESSVWTVFFASNHFFLENINYFSTDAEFMPLLHIWSLAVEEQFYLIWPPLLLLFVALKSKRKTGLANVLLAGVLALSFGASIWAMSAAPSTGFYVMPLRLWELGLGGVSFLLMRRMGRLSMWTARLLYGVGLCLVMGSLVLLTPESAFPGLGAVPICAGTALMLLCGHAPGNGLARLVSISPMVYIGKLSYALYLWHWPVFAYFRIWQNAVEIAPLDAAGCIALTVLLSVLTYHLIEKPIRFGFSRRRVWGFSLTGAAQLSLAGFAGAMSGGLPHRMSAVPEYAASQAVMRGDACNRTKIEGLTEGGRQVCLAGAPWNEAQTRIVLWGDSHADQMLPIVERAIGEQDMAVMLWSGCPNFIDNKRVKRWYGRSTVFSDRCETLRQSMLDWMANDYAGVDAVILVSAFNGYPDSLYETSRRDRSIQQGVALVDTGMRAFLDDLPEALPTLIMTDFPSPGGYPDGCAWLDVGGLWRNKNTEACLDIPTEVMTARYSDMSENLMALKSDSVRVLDALNQWCDTGTCPMFLQGRAFYRDGRHIRENLSAREKDMLVEKLELKGSLDWLVTRSQSRKSNLRASAGLVLGNDLTLRKPFWTGPADKVTERVPVGAPRSLIFGDRSKSGFNLFTSAPIQLSQSSAPLQLDIAYRSRAAAKNIAVLQIKAEGGKSLELHLASNAAFQIGRDDAGAVTTREALPVQLSGDQLRVTLPMGDAPGWAGGLVATLYPAAAGPDGVMQKSESGFFELMGFEIRKAAAE